MISLDEINSEIEKLQAQTPTYQTIGILADLYTVRDAMSRNVPPEGSSEFRQVCSGNSATMAVFDELMAVLKVIQPKLYDCVMRRLTAD